MLMSIKKLILAITIVLGGVIVFGLYYVYGLAAGITPAIGGGAIYIWWQAYKRKNPSAKEFPDMPTFHKIKKIFGRKDV
jgi:hypothetical protein